MVVSSDGGGSAAPLLPDIGSSSTNNTIQVAPPIPQPPAESAVRNNNRSSITNDGDDPNINGLPQLACGTRIHPPKNGRMYSKEEIQTLGKTFDKSDILKAIKASRFPMGKSTINGHLKDFYMVYPKQPEDVAKIDAMIESTRASRAVSSNMEVDEPRSEAAVPEEASTSTNSTLLCMEVEESTPPPISPPESTSSPMQVGGNCSSCVCCTSKVAAAPMRDEDMPCAQQEAATQNKRKHDEIDSDTTVIEQARIAAH